MSMRGERRFATNASSRLRRSPKGSGRVSSATVLQKIVGANEGRMAFDQLAETVLRFSRCCRSPKGATRYRPGFFASDKQLAVERAFEIEDLQDVREGAGDVVAGARIELFARLSR